MGEMRETVARIIDPSSWRVMDGYLAEVKRKYKGEPAGYDPAAFKDKKSLAKADAILSALSPVLTDETVEACERVRDPHWWARYDRNLTVTAGKGTNWPGRADHEEERRDRLAAMRAALSAAATPIGDQR